MANTDSPLGLDVYCDFCYKRIRPRIKPMATHNLIWWVLVEESSFDEARWCHGNLDNGTHQPNAQSTHASLDMLCGV